MPKSWDEFEDIVSDVLKRRWKNPNVTRNGRTGQRQQGVDIYGLARHLKGFVGAQCKRTDAFAFADAKAEIEAAEGFVPPLAEFVIATTTRRDAPLQQKLRVLSEQRLRASKFPVEIMFWEDICLDLAGSPDLLAKHFPGWTGLVDRQPHIEVTWWVEDKGAGALTVRALRPFLSEFERSTKPFSDDDLEFIKEQNQKDGELAVQYNAQIAAALARPHLRKEWIRYTAWERWSRADVYAVAVVVDGAPAQDVLITLTFPDSLQVLDPEQEPIKPKESPLPQRPEFEYERERWRAFNGGGFAALSALTERMAFLSGWRREFGSPRPLRVQRPMRDPSRRVDMNSNEVLLHIEAIAHRRMQLFEGERLGVKIAGLETGSFNVTWRADAGNLQEPILGNLQVSVVDTD